MEGQISLSLPLIIDRVTKQTAAAAYRWSTRMQQFYRLLFWMLSGEEEEEEEDVVVADGEREWWK